MLERLWNKKALGTREIINGCSARKARFFGIVIWQWLGDRGIDWSSTPQSSWKRFLTPMDVFQLGKKSNQLISSSICLGPFLASRDIRITMLSPQLSTPASNRRLSKALEVHKVGWFALLLKRLSCKIEKEKLHRETKYHYYSAWSTTFLR